MTLALAQMQHWFSEEQRTPCPVCRTNQAIANVDVSVLVCLACAPVSIPERKRARGAREDV